MPLGLWILFSHLISTPSLANQILPDAKSRHSLQINTMGTRLVLSLNGLGATGLWAIMAHRLIARLRSRCCHVHRYDVSEFYQLLYTDQAIWDAQGFLPHLEKQWRGLDTLLELMNALRISKDALNVKERGRHQWWWKRVGCLAKVAFGSWSGGACA